MRRVAAVALVFAVVAAACTGDESDRPASTTTSPAVTTAPMSTAGPTATSPPTALEAKPYGGTVRVPQLETSSLNPWLSAAAASKRTQELFQPQVWTIDPDLDVRPGIVIPLEPSAANDALAGRAVHVDWPLLAPEVADVFDGADIRVVSQPASGGWTHLTFQFSVDSDDTAANPLRDERFRQAVALALDRPSLARAVTGTDRAILQSPLGAISPSLSLEPWDRYDLDLESARQLVAEVCQDFGRDCSAQPLTVIAQAGDQQVRRLTLDTVAETLAAIGLDVDVELIPEREWFSRGIGSGDWDLSTWTWVSTPGLLGAIEMLHLFDPLGLDLNYWADSDNTARLERYSEILAEIDTTIFEPDLVPLIAEAERILADELVVLPLFEHGGDTAWHDDMVGGLTPHPVTALGLWDAALWYRVDDNAGNEELTPRQIVELYGDADLDPPVSE